MKIKKIPQPDNDNRCVAFVGAMLTDTTVKMFENFIKKKPPYTDNDLVKYLLHHKVLVSFKPAKNVKVNKKTVSVTLDIENIPAYVLTKRDGINHIIIWDGKEFIDPLERVKNVNIKDYKILSWQPISKL